MVEKEETGRKQKRLEFGVFCCTRILTEKMEHFEDKTGKRKESFDLMDCFSVTLENI